MAAYHGTLAALRCLGRAGIAVTLAESNPLVPAVWSRFAARRVRCPDPENPSSFIPWLLDFGVREPGHVLHPTSDDVAWLYARHRQELSRHFILWHPDVETTYRMLNKTRLQSAAAAAGLPMPRTWVPLSEDDFARIETEARFPVVIKPQTQILLRPHAKGVAVDHPRDLRRAYAAFSASVRYHPWVLEHDGGVGQATVQEYCRSAAENVYGITGFIDDSGELSAARASRKILQDPRQLGVGLCFERAEVREELLTKVIALCRRVGFHGVFEAEFVERDRQSLLIDFNPRFYGQMAFDIARGLPQPLLMYEAATGQRGRLRERIQAAQAGDDRSGLVYCRKLELKLTLVLRRLSRSMSRQESERWWEWLSTHRDRMVDGVFDPEDSRPAAVEAIHRFASYARHPRSFVRQVLFG